MRKLKRWMLALGLCLALTVCGALAAEGDITVQLDGAPLTFTDAVPQVRDQRTYLPFRAVFEAMGAEVDYEGQTITARRGGKTLTMTVGSTEAAVEENGVTLPIHMDVAPYVDPATWRTYVPVRFAAQAFDCTVGWDQGALTAIIIDTEKLVNAAKAGKSYTYLEKLAAMGEQYSAGLWDMTATLDADVSMGSASLLAVEGGVKGTMESSTKMDMTMRMTMDMDGLMGMAAVMGGQVPSAEDQAALDALKTEGVGMTVRGDLNSGKLYMNMDLGALGAQAGVEADAWYELDMAALMEESGLEWSGLTTAGGNSDMLGAFTALLNADEPTDSATAYTDLQVQVNALWAAFADESFGAKDGAYVAEYSVEKDGTTLALALTLTVDGDKLSSYAMDITAGSDALGAPLTMAVTASMTADGRMNAGVELEAGGMFAMTMTMDGAYTPGTAAPVTTPPTGGKLIPFDELVKQGVIGGEDGPTALVGSLA